MRSLQNEDAFASNEEGPFYLYLDLFSVVSKSKEVTRWPVFKSVAPYNVSADFNV